MRALFALLLMAAPAAAAQTITAADPQSIVGAMRAYGHKASVDPVPQDDGSPVLRGAVNGLNYTVYFYSCQAGSRCQDIQFMSSFDLEDAEALDATYVNDWNNQWAAGTLEVDEMGDPYLSYYLTTVGGLTPANFDGVLAVWTATLEGFAGDIGW